MKSSIEIAREFAAGATRGHAANLFIENNTIYSKVKPRPGVSRATFKTYNHDKNNI